MPTINLGQIAGIHIGTVAPSNTKILWYDDNIGQKIVKYYDIGTATWVSFSGAGYLPLSGGTMSPGSFITLDADPVNLLHAATKQYVDNLVSTSANTLAGILAVGNTTGANNISIDSGQSIQYNEGLGGSLVSAVTTANRTWTLPDSDGTLLLGSGITDKVARWNSGSLTDGAIWDDGSVVGIGGVGLAGTSLTITSILSSGLVIASQNAGGSTAANIAAIGPGGMSNIGLYSTATSATSSNVGAKIIGSTGFQAIGLQATGSSGTGSIIGLTASYGGNTAPTITANIVGGNEGGSAIGSLTGVSILGGIDEGQIYTETDYPQIYSSIVGHWKGTTPGAVTRHAGYFINEVSNLGTNIGAYISATGGATNYGIIVASGLSGFGVPTPTKRVEISDGLGVFRFDNTLVTSAYNVDIDSDDFGTSFTNDHANDRWFQFKKAGTSLVTIGGDGKVMVSPTTTPEAHFHVMYGGSLEGTIRSTSSDSTSYTYLTPNSFGNLLLENNDITNNNSGGIHFGSKGTGGTKALGSFISPVFHSRGVATVDSDLAFGTSTGGVMSEQLRVFYSGKVSIGTNQEYAKLTVHSDIDSPEGATIINDSVGTSARGQLTILAADGGGDSTNLLFQTSGTNATGFGTFVGETKYFTKAGHIVTGGKFGHINIYPRSSNATPIYGVRVFTGGSDYNEDKLRLYVDSSGKFGFNLAKAGYSGAAVDTNLSDFHVGTGAYFESAGATAGDHHIFKKLAGTTGGVVLTDDSTFVLNNPGVKGWKFSAVNTTGPDDTLTIGVVDASLPGTFIDVGLYLENGLVGVGDTVANETLTVNGVLSLKHEVTPATTGGFGKIYPKGDNNLYYLDGLGVEQQLNVGIGTAITGTGTPGEIAFFDTGAQVIHGDPNLTWVGGVLTVLGDLTVTGTTTTINSDVVVIQDPVFTLGGDTPPVLDDGKDRGIEYRWHDGVSPHIGYFGFDRSSQRFTFIPEATNVGEVFSGTLGDIDIAKAYTSSFRMTTGASDTYLFMGDSVGDASWTSINSLIELVTPSAANDYVLVYDAITGTHKKVALNNLTLNAAHALLGPLHDDTTPGVVQRGDLVTGQGVVPTWTRLGIGGAGMVLSSDGTDISWQPGGAGTVTGNGTANYLSKWDAVTNIVDSQIQDDGTTLGIGQAPGAGSYLSLTTPVVTLPVAQAIVHEYTGAIMNHAAMSVKSYGASAGVKIGLHAATWDGPTNIGVKGSNGSASTGANNFGVYGSSLPIDLTGTNIGGYFEASGALVNYGLQIVDGSEGIGKFLKSVSVTGHGQWSSINITDITDGETIYRADGAIVGGNRQIDLNGNLLGFVDTLGTPKVGIGTNSPSGTLELSTPTANNNVTFELSELGVRKWYIETDFATVNEPVHFKNNAGNHLMTFKTTTRRVGIGTSEPKSQLHLAGPSSVGSYVDEQTLVVSNTSGGLNGMSVIRLAHESFDYVGAAIVGGREGDFSVVGQRNGNLELKTGRDDGAGNVVLQTGIHINSDQLVGINLANPAHRLDVQNVVSDLTTKALHVNYKTTAALGGACVASQLTVSGANMTGGSLIAQRTSQPNAEDIAFYGHYIESSGTGGGYGLLYLNNANRTLAGSQVKGIQSQIGGTAPGTAYSTGVAISVTTAGSFQNIGLQISATLNGIDNCDLMVSGDNTMFGSSAIPEVSSVVEMRSTDKGFLGPRMTGLEIEAIGSPVDGLQAYCNNPNGVAVNVVGLWIYDGVAWTKIGSGGSSTIWSLTTQAGAAYTAADGEFVVVTASTISVTLPAPVLNRRVSVKATNPVLTTVRVITPGVETIDGVGEYVYSVQYEQKGFICDGTNWMIY